MEVTEVVPKSSSPIDLREITINGSNFGTSSDGVEVIFVAQEEYTG